jgi:hypothetical protein
MKIKRVFYRYKQNEKDLDLIQYINDFKTLREIVKSNQTDKNGNPRCMIVNPTDKSLELRINKKSLTLKAAKLKNIIIQWEAGDKDEENLLSYLNRANEFVIHFSNYKFIYFARKLFSDNKLLGDLDGLMRIFKPYEKLGQVNSEKGLKFTARSKKFSSNSIFGFVEKHFGRQTDFLICDDLGNEWADHIGLSKDAIMFIHSKYGKPGLGASQFQDVNGQAQKNLGNMVPADHQWEGKCRSWANYYKINGTVTSIDRIRKGTNAGDAVTYYKRLLNDPNVKKQVYLVINFLSKSDFRKKLIALRQGNQVTNKNQVIQLLWFISSLISSCWETGTEVYVCCAP